MSELRPMTGLLFKNTSRIVPEDNVFWGVIRVGSAEYKLRAYGQKIPGRWTLKLEPVAVRSGKARHTPARSGNRRSI